jgi:CspA family cold shock protein
MMMAKKAITLSPMMAATINARMRSRRDGSGGVGVLTRPAYRPTCGVFLSGPVRHYPGVFMPTGKVKFYDQSKGFGFIQSDEGDEVFLPASAVADGATVKSGSRVEFSIVEGRRGAQALSLRVLETPHLARADRQSPDDMAVIVEDLVKILERVGGGLRKGHYPDRDFGQKVAAMLRRVADDFDA